MDKNELIKRLEDIEWEYFEVKDAKSEEIEKQGFILTPGRYVGTEEEVDNGIPFEDKMKELITELKKQMEEGKKLDEWIKKNLAGIEFKV